MRLPIRRRAAGGRRTARIQRRSSLISRTRLLAALGLAAVSGAFYLATTAKEFVVQPAGVTIAGTTYTDVAQVRADLGFDPDDDSIAGLAARNVFRVRTDQIQQRIEALPPVLSASVVTAMPNRLAIAIQERVPIFVWQVAESAWLVDRTGFLLATAAAVTQPTNASPGLPLVKDLRTGGTPIALAGTLAPLDLDTARLLGAVTTADLGSAAPELDISIDDIDGWMLSVPGSWRAVFGIYTPDLHTTADISRQVQCLASLLANRERTLASVILSVASDRCGTFVEGTPAPPASAVPHGSGGPRYTPGPHSTAAP